MDRILEINGPEDIPEAVKGTPIGDLLEYHNLGREFDKYTKAELLIGMCMDNRKHLRIPDQFAYILRTGGANLRPSEFKVSYAIAVGGIRYIALLAHSQCGMSGLMNRKEQFINGLVENAGWKRDYAEDHFLRFAPMFEIGNEIDFVISEALRLKQRYPGVTVVPLYYRVEDNHLLFICNNC